MMKPELIHGDCLEIMPNIPDKSVDCIICDLPYGTTACKWDIILPFDELWKQYNRIIKPNGAIVLFGSQPFTSLLVSSNLKGFKYEWIWEKSKASNFLNVKHVPLKAHENILVFGNGKCNYYPQKTDGVPYDRGKRKMRDDGKATEVYDKIKNGGNYIIKSEDGKRHPRSVQYFKTAEIDGSFHPTQKPLALLEYLIKTYSNEGDLILDNCMGSGSTGVACKNMCRNFIGIEKEEKYFEIAKKRIL